MKRKEFFKRCKRCYHYLPKDHKYPARCWARDEENYRNGSVQKIPLFSVFYKLAEAKEHCKKFLDGIEEMIRNKKW